MTSTLIPIFALIALIVLIVVAGYVKAPLDADEAARLDVKDRLGGIGSVPIAGHADCARIQAASIPDGGNSGD